MSTNSSAIRIKSISLRENGKTFREISQILNIPLGTSHLWTKHVKLSPSQKQHIKINHQKKLLFGRKLASKKQKQHTQKRNAINIQQGKDVIGNIIDEKELLLLGAGLYWAEGFKKDSRLGFANSDPQMIKLFLTWLFKIGNIPKTDIRLRVGINQQYKQNIKDIEKKWSNITSIPLSQFQKPSFQKTPLKKQYKNDNNYLGVLRIRANNQVSFYYKILGMISKLQSLAG
jgi:hypothetical protein